MGTSLVPATWPALDDAEVQEVLAGYVGCLGPGVATARPVWHSPRPMSAGGLVEVGTTTVFVKRHDPRVRSIASLRTEHRLAAHLRRRGVAVPKVVVADDGSTVAQVAGGLYEVFARARGEDLYAEVPSWHPYASTRHAAAAGSALARFHVAAAGFDAADRAFGPLVSSVVLAGSSDPGAALDRLLEARPALAAALDRAGAAGAVHRHCVPALERASRVLRHRPRGWAHGDWHPSNLTWWGRGPTASVAEVLDLGLSNRTAAVHDVAVALERSFVPWLSGPGTRLADVDGVDAFLEGYGVRRSWGAGGWRDVADVLPACHVEYALSEVEYFATVAGSDADAALAANDYLIGHCRYFEEGEGAALLEHLRTKA
jgi:Ser/Thr protein kinase RdoA (MazF antagonist)